MRKLFSLLTFATLAMVVAAWLVIRPDPEAAPAAPHVSAELARVEPAVPRRAPEAPEAPVVHVAPVVHDDLPAAAPGAAERRALQGRALEAELHRRGRDPAWSTQAETRVRARMAARPLPDAHDVTVECGASLCRLDATFESVDARDHGLSGIPGLVPWDTEGFFLPGADDERHLVVYVMREGQSLPPGPP